jgi:hypothetical protein
MKPQRKHYTPEVAILRRHLLEKEPISKLCDVVPRVQQAVRGGNRYRRAADSAACRRDVPALCVRRLSEIGRICRHIEK